MQDLFVTEFHHGDCKGADAEAHDIVRAFFPEVKIVVHPPEIEFGRAFKQGDVLMEPLDYLTRDRKIVDTAYLMFGAPKTMQEQTRSGTWYTIRYTRKTGKPVILLER